MSHLQLTIPYDRLLMNGGTLPVSTWRFLNEFDKWGFTALIASCGWLKTPSSIKAYAIHEDV